MPSTTATSLTSLGTALPPAMHGVVGYTSRIPGTHELLNALMWSKDVDPHQWQPHPTAFARLAAAGVHTTTVNKREFAGSGLTQASTRGAEFVGADRLGERLVAVQAASRRGPCLTYMYDGDLDWTGHRYGVASAQWEAQLSMIDLSAERLRESLPDDVRIVVVADHGMVDCPRRTPYRRGGRTRSCVTGCSSSAARRASGTSTAASGPSTTSSPPGRATWATAPRCSAATRPTPAAGSARARAEVRPRIGDVVVACHGDAAVLDTAAFPYEARLIGMHGSLTSAEMLVPVLVA